MPIAQVLLSNTFNEFRTTFNDSANVINSLQDGTGNSNVDFLVVSGRISSDLIPSANITYDLGTASQRWKDLYLSGNTIFLGDAKISYDGTTFKVAVGVDDIFTADDSGASVVESTTANTITANTVTINQTLETPVISSNVVFNTSGQIEVPVGGTADRGSSNTGAFRYNTDTNSFEGYSSLGWGAIGGGGGATGGGSDEVFIETDQTANNTYTITAGKNAMTVGPLTVADGVTVQVPSGTRYVII